MSQLDNLIFDRTSSDITNDTDKAYIAYTDLNRVEEACAYIAGVLGVTIATKTWTIDDMRKETEMVRLRGNIKKLQDAYYAVTGTPTLPTEIKYLNINEANNIEKILYDLNKMYWNVQGMKQRLSFYLGRKTLGNREAS